MLNISHIEVVVFTVYFVIFTFIDAQKDFPLVNYYQKLFHHLDYKYQYE